MAESGAGYVMVLQEPGERQAEAPFRQSPRAAMAGRAAVREELCGRLAGIEVLRGRDRHRQRARLRESPGARSRRAPGRNSEINVVP